MKESKQLSDTTIGLMIGTALFYDALQWLLTFVFMGWIVIPLFYLTFIVWFKMHGISFLSAKRAPTQAVGFFLETISLGVLPAFTFIVARVALDAKVKKVIGAVENKEAA